MSADSQQQAHEAEGTGTVAEQLLGLVDRVAATPWPQSSETYAAWARATGLPTTGSRPDDGGRPDASTYVAPSHGGQAIWHFAPGGQLTHVSVILDTLTPVEFNGLRSHAEQLRAALDQRWELCDADTRGASWRAEWRAGTAGVELYWSDPTRDGAPTDAALHLALSPARATGAQSRRHWQITLQDRTVDRQFHQEIECEPPATELCVVRFHDAGRALVCRATVDDLRTVGVTGGGEDETTARVLAATMAIGTADEVPSRAEGRSQIEAALDPRRWAQSVTVQVNDEPRLAWVHENRQWSSWAVYLVIDTAVIAAGFRTDPHALSLEVTL